MVFKSHMQIDVNMPNNSGYNDRRAESHFLTGGPSSAVVLLLRGMPMNQNLLLTPRSLLTARHLLAGILLACFAAIATAQLVSPIVAERGATPTGSRLTNLSFGASWNSPVNPSLPTFVITHGYNPTPNHYQLTTPQAYALKIRSRFGGNVNVLSFHWDSRGQGSPQGNNANAIGAGTTLARELIARGVAPANTTMIGHSMGTVVVTTAANAISRQTGSCTRKLVLLDAPMRRHPLLVEAIESTCAMEVNNIWADGISGLGAPINHPRIRDYQAPIRQSQASGLGWSDPARNNHIDILLWYYETIL